MDRMRWFLFFILISIIIFSLFWTEEEELPQEPQPAQKVNVLPKPFSMTAAYQEKKKSRDSIEYSDDILIIREDMNLGPMVEKGTLDLLVKIIKQVDEEITKAVYGEPGSMSYNIMYLFKQSLRDYREFLANPSGGPMFNILFDRNFSGRYNFQDRHIMLGSKVMQHGEGRFISTLFHEYQHHMFHSIYGTPEKTDIVRKFYNELTGYLFEFLLLSYIPPKLFINGHHRGEDPRDIRELLKESRSYEVIAIVYEWMFLPGNKPLPIYVFLKPVAQGLIQKDDLVFSINAEFHPDPDIADDLQDISEDYFGVDEDEEEEEEEEILEVRE